MLNVCVYVYVLVSIINIQTALCHSLRVSRVFCARPANVSRRFVQWCVVKYTRTCLCVLCELLLFFFFFCQRSSTNVDARRDLVCLYVYRSESRQSFLTPRIIASDAREMIGHLVSSRAVNSVKWRKKEKEINWDRNKRHEKKVVWNNLAIARKCSRNGLSKFY